MTLPSVWLQSSTGTNASFVSIDSLQNMKNIFSSTLATHSSIPAFKMHGQRPQWHSNRSSNNHNAVNNHRGYSFKFEHVVDVNFCDTDSASKLLFLGNEASARLQSHVECDPILHITQPLPFLNYINVL